MKNSKLYIIGLLSAFAFTGNVYAQRDSDVETSIVKYTNPSENITVRAGGRISFDAAHYINDRMDQGSGTTIGEARITLFTSFYDKFDIKLDMDFARGEVTFRDIFARWNITDRSALRIGHYIQPFSLDRTASTVDRFFISSSGTVNSLTIDRRLGISYMQHNDWVWGSAAAFGGNVYKKYAGDDGWGLSARLVFNPEVGDNMILHVGGGIQFRKPDANGFDGGDDDYNRYIRYSSNGETVVDRTNFLYADIENAHNELRHNVELLFSARRFFLQSEYTGTRVTRKRDNQRLFEDQLGGMWSHQTLEAWENWFGKTLRTVSFEGVYVQAGFLIKGSRYNYNRHNAILAPCRDKGAIELVLRYNHTNLNDVDGIWSQDKFVNVVGADAPNYNYSIGGGIMNSYTIGANYYFNKYARVMVNYGYQTIKNFTLEDKYAHNIQARLQLSF